MVVDTAITEDPVVETVVTEEPVVLDTADTKEVVTLQSESTSVKFYVYIC